MNTRHLIVRWMPRPLRNTLRSWNSVRQVRRFSERDWPEAEAVRALVRSGDVVVDAGANIGYLTAVLARWVGRQGVVHSIEPVPETAALLQRNVRSLGLTQVRCHACGISDAAGWANMEIPSYAGGVENFYESRLVSGDRSAGNARCVRVALRTLDELLQESLPRVTFMKIDVEGHEEPALRGAAQVLSEAQPALLVEINDSLDSPCPATSRLLDYLRELGYRPYLRERGDWILRSPGQRAVDYFFLTNRHLSRRVSTD